MAHSEIKKTQTLQPIVGRDVRLTLEQALAHYILNHHLISNYETSSGN